MMFILTPGQRYILTILRCTRFLRVEQAFRLLSTLDSRNSREHTGHCLRQLRHMQKIIWRTETVIALPHLYQAAIDKTMLSAVDIMLDLTDCKVLSLTASEPPYTLCFLSEQKGKRLGCFALMHVPIGAEATASAFLHGADAGRTVIFLLSSLEQRPGIRTSLPHFFAVSDSGRYRYFEGGG